MVRGTLLLRRGQIARPPPDRFRTGGPPARISGLTFLAVLLGELFFLEPRHLSPHIVDHIDHVCQLAGNARHAALGTDLDGGFGKEQSPADIETIADLGKIATILQARGYSQEDIDGILDRNWVDFFCRAWGED